MNAAIVIVALFVVVGVVAIVSLRGRTREVRTVDHHQRALDTLERFAKERGVQADHRVGLPKSEQRRVAAGSDDAPPVRLDLGRLADLTDPDMIRIEADYLASGASAETSAQAPGDEEPTKDAAVAASTEDEAVEQAPPPATRPIDRAVADRTTAMAAITPDRAPEDRTELLSAVGPSAAVAADDRSHRGDDAVREHRVYQLHRRTRLPAVIGGAGIAAIAIGLVAFELSSHHAAAPTSQSASSPTSSAPSTTKQSSNAKTSTTSASKKTSTTSKTTSSAKKAKGSASAGPAVALVSSSSTGATYNVVGGAHTVVLQVSSAPCWVEDAQAPGGQVLWDATLPAGGSYTISWSGGPLWLRTGNSGVLSVSVNGHPVHFSAPPGPFDLLFQPVR
ncbi:hypothetical protein Afer_0541 [Acidimicrobium ferrooxidans DSM 10331]|uniref:Cytoskeleton protein RodZ-like C-terminal domain-containing protein n=1 Tax=Acidimicrobium ferrooxidans (strain DSM 10331 / JCM 15462 / NBRC 103882 / ICP) TaxID=525909 RepID=C7M3A8_ACIFD|nr:DUF4115 domain-containing protein [Acidimicrobium ferrooxidans]ACU53502.1 hypothetical protein Afer_0541 [Acidimicrobium ferrooxidans DSM 10331]